MYHTIEILDGLMCVIDEHGHELNCQRLTSNRKAKRQIQEWTTQYPIKVADAYQQLDEHFSRRYARPAGDGRAC